MSLLISLLTSLAMAWIKAVMAREDLIGKVKDEATIMFLRRVKLAQEWTADPASNGTLGVRDPASHLEIPGYSPPADVRQPPP